MVEGSADPSARISVVAELRDLVFVGGGEHACVVADAALAAGGFRLVGYTDPEGGVVLESRFGVPHLGGDAAGAKAFPRASFVVCVGSLAAKDRALAILVEAGVTFASIIHPRATVSPSATVEHGVVVLAGAVVNTGAVLCAHAIVNTGAIVEHDVVVGVLAHVAPAAAIGGGARIRARATIGLGARVRDHVTVGAEAFVGMGAVVVADVPAGACVIGVPARVAPRRAMPEGSR